MFLALEAVGPDSSNPGSGLQSGEMGFDGRDRVGPDSQSVSRSLAADYYLIQRDGRHRLRALLLQKKPPL